ncbi:receptor-like protein kinase FERONIA [Momordica charantia]|uniref:Receptor-like protein kinase FERONIA n=1 Tax=Momordica charantia TaxID=3673 RepID=A0A6J1DW94_MOMCH|nr:receptor-like protein kinase FERONIA [Momordica charantia]
MASFEIEHAYATILFTLFYLQFLSLPIAGDSPPAYIPTDDIALDCGSYGASIVYGGNGRPWANDFTTKFFPSNYHHNSKSVSVAAEEKQFPSAIEVPYINARLSRFQFTYLITVSPGQKFVRLHFNSAPFSNFQPHKAVFSVTAGLYTLLRDFNVDVHADASGATEFFREYCVYVDEKGVLDLTFTPTDQDSYAFISGIEIVSMPTNLYYTPPEPEPNDEGGRGLKLIGHNNQFFPIENYTSLETVYRMNIGGRAIAPEEDTGMFRTWSEESNLLDAYIYNAQPFSLSMHINYTKTPPYTAPEDLYRTARSMGPNSTLNKSYNLTWEYPVHPGFFYMLRLHFCEFEPEITDRNDRVFLIYIGDMIAEQSADVFRWAGGKYNPIHRDYVVNVPISKHENRVNLSVKLQANPKDFLTRFTNVIMNGIEIFKLNDSSGNLAGQNPDIHLNTPTQSLPPSISQSKNSKSKAVIIIVPTVGGGVVALLALSVFVFRTFTNKSSSDGTSKRALYSISTNKSSKSCSTNIPSDTCHYFSLRQIKAATKDFADALIIGVGGFGNVYKGYIGNAATQVAIKRLKPGSRQGEKEFKTEIEMLSQLRHVHLVSLIGYCNDGIEMILVYDYMSRGTLKNHLYGDGDEQQQPLTWEQRLQICIGVAKGLHYLHTGVKHTIIHRDIKSTNILLDEKWVAKVSDFGLSKARLESTSKAHVSTVVKGSFGYLDPEYYRLQKLTEKSDVYSFGVVLCEVLCARPALIHTEDETSLLLAELVRRCYREKTVDQIIDSNIKNEIAPECFRKFIQITVSCIQDNGNKRPSMKDVLQGLEFASQLQESSKKLGIVELICLENYDGLLFEEGISSNKTEVVTSSNESSSISHNKGMSGAVFSEIKDLQAR